MLKNRGADPRPRGGGARRGRDVGSSGIWERMTELKKQIVSKERETCEDRSNKLK